MSICQLKITKECSVLLRVPQITTAISPLPYRDAIINNKHNKRELSRVLSLFNLGPNITMDSRDDGAFTHDEADVTMIAYMLQNLVRI